MGAGAWAALIVLMIVIFFLLPKDLSDTISSFGPIILYGSIILVALVFFFAILFSSA